jgi:HSP20 family protein
MNDLTQQVKQGVEQALTSVSHGWHELKERAIGALTRFQRSREKDAASSGDDLRALSRWGFMAADVADGKDSVVVRVEVPGMSRSDLRIELRGDTLSVQGDKRIEREFEGDGQLTLQAAYGSFRRDIQLPAAVNPEKAQATCRDGILRVELPKAPGTRARHLTVNVN